MSTLRRQAEAVALAGIIQGARLPISEADSRRFEADARDLMALVRTIIRLHRRWHSGSFAPLIQLLSTTTSYIASMQPERDRAAKRKHLRLIRSGK